MGLAARGAREHDGKKILVESEAVALFFRARAKRIYVKTFVATLALMLAGRAWLHFVRN